MQTTEKTAQPVACPPTLGALLLSTLVAAFCWSAVAVAPAGAAPSFENPHGDLSISCEACHSTAGWTPLRSPLDFDHTVTGFALEAGHQRVDCFSCHQDLEFTNIGSACADCHVDPHLGELGFGCESCHSPETWDPRADLAALHDGSLFPLTGAHRAVDCAACHQEDPPFEFQLTPIDCFSCHVDDYRTADLDHVGLGFPTTCEDCHSTQAWQPADFAGGDFDHDAFFPLRGGHAGLDCGICHTAGFGGTPNDCYACHQDDYQSTTDPNHAALGFPLTCENCHGTTTWEGATSVDHDTFFPLNGGHAVLDCQECHAGGFEGTPTDCAACHIDDYNNTNDPDHQAAGFPTTCEDCHNTSVWEDAEFDHDQMFFPIYSGSHQGEWASCDECHVQPGDFGVSECILCHEHNQEDTDDEHDEVNGYVYESQACLNCHPNGEE